MPQDYGKVVHSFWTDPEIKKALTPEQKCLLVYLFSSPHANMIGLYHCPVSYMAEETGLAPALIKDWIAGCLTRYLTYDTETEEVLVHRLARHRIGEALTADDRRRKHVLKLLETAHSRPLRRKFRTLYVAWELPAAADERPKAPQRGHRKPLQRGFERAAAGASEPLRRGSDIRDETKEETEQSNTHSGYGSPTAAGTVRGGWPAEAAELYAQHIGFVAPARFGKALKPVVQRFGWSEPLISRKPPVRRVLECYCRWRPYVLSNGKLPDAPDQARKDVRFCSPEDCAKTYTQWEEMLEPVEGAPGGTHSP